MREWLKIKASVLSLAWLVLFLHDAIPHNHSNHPEASCHNLVHGIEITYQSSGEESGKLLSFTDEFKNGESEEHGMLVNISHDHRSSKVCHFSANLFTKHSPVSLTAFIPGSFVSLCEGNLVEYIILPVESGYSPPDNEWSPKRGPPSIA